MGTKLNRVDIAIVEYNGHIYILQQTSTSVAFVLPVECAHVAIACPYKELAGRFCMQVQVHEKARSIKNTFPGVHESS